MKTFSLDWFGPFSKKGWRLFSFGLTRCGFSCNPLADAQQYLANMREAHKWQDEGGAHVYHNSSWRASIASAKTKALQRARFSLRTKAIFQTTLAKHFGPCVHKDVISPFARNQKQSRGQCSQNHSRGSSRASLAMDLTECHMSHEQRRLEALDDTSGLTSAFHLSKSRRESCPHHLDWANRPTLKCIPTNTRRIDCSRHVSYGSLPALRRALLGRTPSLSGDMCVPSWGQRQICLKPHQLLVGLRATRQST